MGNKNLIITIEREYGSGGRIVGRKLAEELGLHFYDDEILKMASGAGRTGTVRICRPCGWLCAGSG